MIFGGILVVRVGKCVSGRRGSHRSGGVGAVFYDCHRDGLCSVRFRIVVLKIKICQAEAVLVPMRHLPWPGRGSCRGTSPTFPFDIPMNFTGVDGERSLKELDPPSFPVVRYPRVSPLACQLSGLGLPLQRALDREVVRPVMRADGVFLNRLDLP